MDENEEIRVKFNRFKMKIFFLEISSFLGRKSRNYSQIQSDDDLFFDISTHSRTCWGCRGAIAPPSFEDLGKIKIFRAVRRKYLGKTIVFRVAI